MVFTRNGWLASADRADFGGLINDYIPGTSARLAPGVRDDEAGWVLRLFAARFHVEVEPLVAGWCWGYAWRKVRAGAALSEHAAGVAIDLNAPRHGLGERGTFTAPQLVAIRRLLAVFSDDQGPLIRWGGDFGRPDEMHFELIGNLARCKALYARMTQPAAPVRPPVRPPVLAKPTAARPTTMPAPPPIGDDEMRPFLIKNPAGTQQQYAIWLPWKNKFVPATPGEINLLEVKLGVKAETITTAERDALLSIGAR